MKNPLRLIPVMLNLDIPDTRGCPVIPMGAIPRLFIAVAQAFGSDMGIPNELESIAMLRRPSKQTRRKNVGFKTPYFFFTILPKITSIIQKCRLNNNNKKVLNIISHMWEKSYGFEYGFIRRLPVSHIKMSMQT